MKRKVKPKTEPYTYDDLIDELATLLATAEAKGIDPWLLTCCMGAQHAGRCVTEHAINLDDFMDLSKESYTKVRAVMEKHGHAPKTDLPTPDPTLGYMAFQASLLPTPLDRSPIERDIRSRAKRVLELELAGHYEARIVLYRKDGAP